MLSGLVRDLPSFGRMGRIGDCFHGDNAINVSVSVLYVVLKVNLITHQLESLYDIQLYTGHLIYIPPSIQSRSLSNPASYSSRNLLLITGFM